MQLHLREILLLSEKWNITVKASNFGPRGKFGPFFRKGLLLSKRVLQKMNGVKIVDKLSICKVGSVHFWDRIHPKKLQILQAVAFPDWGRPPRAHVAKGGPKKAKRKKNKQKTKVKMKKRPCSRLSCTKQTCNCSTKQCPV